MRRRRRESPPASDAGDLDRWISAVHGVRDPWIVAAAQAGDGPAMRSMAHRIWYSRSSEFDRAARANPALAPALPGWALLHQRIRELEAGERARWFTAAARHGDSEALDELAADVEDRHYVQHLIRADRAAAANRRVPKTADPPECSMGAYEGYASCMLRWAAYLRVLGPEYQAEADDLQDLAQYGTPDEPPVRGGILEAMVDPATIALTAVTTAAVVPFVQAMAAKAAEDSYNGLRRLLRGVLRQCPAADAQGRPARPVLIVSPPPDLQPGAVLQVWTDLPDEAITALSQLLYDLRSSQAAAASGAEKRWYWNGGTRRWELLQPPQAKASKDTPKASRPD